MTLLAILAAATVCLPLAQAVPGIISDGRPPARFQSNANVAVEFHTPEEIEKICSPEGEVCGFVTEACTFAKKDGSYLMILPNPNKWKGDKDSYQKMVAHELGHVNGWPETHGK